MALVLMLPLVTLAYMNWRTRMGRLLAHLAPDCAGQGPSVNTDVDLRFGPRVFVYIFRNQDYAAEFERLNAANVMLP
jgi:hypothetical protein